MSLAAITHITHSSVHAIWSAEVQTGLSWKVMQLRLFAQQLPCKSVSPECSEQVVRNPDAVLAVDYDRL